MPRKHRNRILRLDGKPIHLVAKRAHLMVCAKGCCCGHTERGHAAVPIDFYKLEYKKRKIRKLVQLTMSGCLGPCPLSNVALLFFDGRSIWFQSINGEPQIRAIFDYIDQMLAADGYLPPPPELAEYVFSYYAWTHPVHDDIPVLASRERQRPEETRRPSLSPVADAPGSLAPARDGILLFSHADTDLLTLQAAAPGLPDEFPPVRAIGLAKVSTEEHLASALAWPNAAPRVVIARLLGGVQSFPGLRTLSETARSRGQHLIVVSGTGIPDPELTAASTVSPAIAHEVAAYLQAGGPENFSQMLRFLADHLLLTGYGYIGPAEQPQHGIYHPDLPRCSSHGLGSPCHDEKPVARTSQSVAGATVEEWLARRDPKRPTVGVLFYRSHWMSGNLQFIDAFVREVESRGAVALPVFTASLKDEAEPPAGMAGSKWPAALSFFIAEGRPLIDVLVTTVSFASCEVQADRPTLAGDSVRAFSALGVPVLQAICGSTARWQWDASPRGLSPLDTAMNVALPEFDGRIITAPISFKETVGSGSRQDALRYVEIPDRVSRVAGLALRFAALRHKPNANKRIAFVLTNSPGKAAKIGNAVGLDAPASLMAILEAMQQAGYRVEDVPADGDALIHALIDRCSYDETILTSEQLAQAAGRVSSREYQGWFDRLPESQRRQMSAQWGEAPGQAYIHDDHIALAALELGNVFVALQPPRGHGMDPNAIYHQPDLPPPHNYLALYRWLSEVWQADAIVHVGKHGTLEWLPGKGVGLSAGCYPDSFLGDFPLFYPFIINDPGEGAQAKRRGHAVIIDHLTPPMTTADAHGELAELMQLVDEYYQVESLDPSKMPLVQRQIWDLIRRANLEGDLKYLLQKGDDGHTHEWDDAVTADGTPVTLAEMRGRDVSHLIQELDGYLCELAGAQIRDGLHVLGQPPEGEALVGLLQALTRLPNLDVPSLRASVAESFGLDLDSVLAHRGQALANPSAALELLAGRPIVTNSDALETIDELCHHALWLLQSRDFDADAIDAVIRETLGESVEPSPAIRDVLRFVCGRLTPAIQCTTDEIDNLLAGLEGRYVPAGPSGAPTRGMAQVLPTGRNFYAVDPRALPSEAAWEVGQGLAAEVLRRYLAETGAYPESVGISIWGTSAMRTYGDDVAEVLALLGVRPKWHKENRRVAGVEVIPLDELARPRIDVTVRISGFFRDAFPHLIELLDRAVEAVAERDESLEANFVRKHYLADIAANIAAGLPDAERRARYRVFGAKPGAYGAGLLPLIEERNWRDDADFAETYVNWGGYAYAADAQGVDARDAFRQRLAGVQIALHNQDNREHDIFDSDDYFQFHGGMIATIRSLTGRQPRHYFGDSHDPKRPAVRDLKQEVLRVFRSRVINPKWLEGIKRHGYKGGLELAATVDYLFAYDATSAIAEDWMYEQVAQAYALDPAMREFLGRSNPWALQAVAERLLEAAQRGLWEAPEAATLAALRSLLQGEERLEARAEGTC